MVRYGILAPHFARARDLGARLRGADHLALARARREPIVDLVHYGTPTWLEGAFLNPTTIATSKNTPRGGGHFRGRVRYYTPLNEPRITAWYTGKLGWWPPFSAGMERLHRGDPGARAGHRGGRCARSGAWTRRCCPYTWTRPISTRRLSPSWSRGRAATGDCLLGARPRERSGRFTTSASSLAPRPRRVRSRARVAREENAIDLDVRRSQPLPAVLEEDPEAKRGAPRGFGCPTLGRDRRAPRRALRGHGATAPSRSPRRASEGSVAPPRVARSIPVCRGRPRPRSRNPPDRLYLVAHVRSHHLGLLARGRKAPARIPRAMGLST